MERKETLEKVLMTVLKEFVWNDEVFYLKFLDVIYNFRWDIPVMSLS